MDFQGSRVTSDGGLTQVRELDERLGFGDLIVQHLTDSRRGKNTQLPLADLLRQCVYSRIAGYGHGGLGRSRTTLSGLRAGIQEKKMSLSGSETHRLWYSDLDREAKKETADDLVLIGRRTPASHVCFAGA